MIGQLPVYYLPMSEWWRKPARAQFRSRHLLRDYIFLPHGLQRFFLKLSRRTSYSAKRFFLERKDFAVGHFQIGFAHAMARADYSTHVLPLLPVSKIKKLFSFDYYATITQ